MQVVEILGVKKFIKDQLLFKAKHLVINQGDRIGLVGANGKGKSTLLNMIAGLDTDYHGQIQVTETLDYVKQKQEKSVYSGGEQVMNDIWRAVASQKSLILFDEPTAHLDQASIQSVIDIIQTYPGAILVVSHDRDFLDQVVRQTWVIDQNEIQVYSGNYTYFQEQKKKERERQQKAYDRYRNKREQLEKAARQRATQARKSTARKKGMSSSEFRANQFSSQSFMGLEKKMDKSAKALRKRIDQLEKVERPEKQRRFLFREVGHLTDKNKTLLHLDGGEISIAEHHLFEYGHLKIMTGEKISLNGSNGSGKTTFLRQIMARQLSGYYAEDLSIGYFAQNLGQLDDEELVYSQVADSLQSEYVIRTVLATLGFDGHRLHQRTRTLSGGERVRLSLAKILLGDYHLLILDEPVNYLDLTTLESVEEFIINFPGAVLLTSHDKRFVHRTTDRHYYIKDNRLVSASYQKSYQDQIAQRIDLLELKLQELIANPDASLEEIRDLKNKIEQIRIRT